MQFLFPKQYMPSKPFLYTLFFLKHLWLLHVLLCLMQFYLSIYVSLFRLYFFFFKLCVNIDFSIFVLSDSGNITRNWLFYSCVACRSFVSLNAWMKSCVVEHAFFMNVFLFFLFLHMMPCVEINVSLLLCFMTLLFIFLSTFI